MTARDDDILRHIGLYRLAIRETVAATFSLAHPGNVLQRLRDGGLIVARDGLPGTVTYYQLTARGAADRVSLERAKPLGASALRHHLAVLWFCHLAPGGPRRRLEDSEVQELFSVSRLSVRQSAFCVEATGESRRLVRVLVPSEAVPARRVVTAVRRVVSELAGTGEEMRGWLRLRTLGVAVLADSFARRAVIERALGAAPDLSDLAVGVHAVASPRTLPQFLSDRRSQSSASQMGPSRA